MARVETDAEALVPSERGEDGGELVERAADRPAGARGVLHQQPGSVVAAVEHLLDRRHEPLQAGLEAGTEMRAEVEDNRLGLEHARRVERRAHGVDALRVDGVVRRGEVHEIDRVNEDRDAGVLAFRPELLEIRRVVLGESPGARALDEELHRLRAHRRAVVERLLDTSRAVGTEQHASNLTACPFVSAWLRARPASSTSGTSGRRSSTGCSPGTRAGNFGCGSRTPIRTARWRRRPSRSRIRFAGSGSTGTARSPSSSTGCRTVPPSRAVSSRRARLTRTRARSAFACPTRAARPGTTRCAAGSSSRTTSSRTSYSFAPTDGRPTTSRRRWRTYGTESPTSFAVRTTSRTRRSRSTSSAPSALNLPSTRMSRTSWAPTARACRSD